MTLLFVLGLVGSVSATTFYCDPVSGSMSNDGSSGSPWSTLQAVFDNNKIESRDRNLDPKNQGAPVKAGDTIKLRAGNHGGLYATDYCNTAHIIVEADTGHEPVLTSLELRYSFNWTFRGLTVTNGQGPTGYLVQFRYSCHDITVEDCYLYSEEDSSGWSSSQWNSVSSGLWLEGADCLALNNDILNIDMGIYVTGSGAQLIGNTIQNIAKDGIRGSGGGITLEDNAILDCYNVNDNHDDGIQWYSGSGGTAPNVTIRTTYINDDTSGGTRNFIGNFQGIGCFDDYLTYWTVENNIVICNHWHGISLYNADYCTIANNTAYNYKYIASESDMNTWINFFEGKQGGGGTGNTLVNNLMHSSTSGYNQQVTRSNYTQYFVNTNPSSLDLHLKSGSPAIDAGTSSGAPSVDFDGVSRPQGSGYDVGAYEYVTGGMPGQATNPSPSNSATSVSTTADLSWTAGSGATSHDVYFGTDSTPDSGEFQGNQTSTTFDPGTMSTSTTYYWRIDEKNASGTTTGTVWNFTTESAPDTTAPSPDPMTWSTEPYATGTSSISMTATTATDVSGVEYYFECTAGGGNDSGWQDSTTYSDTGLSASTQYTYRVKARDKSSNQNETAYSTTKSATTQSSSAVTSTTSWQNFVITTQTGSFTFEFDATANNNNIDVCISTVSGEASGWDDMAAISRFNPSGYIDARDGGSYSADASVSYSSGNTYHIRMEIDVSTHTYDVYVTPPSESEVTLASNYAFRTSQQSVTSLDHWTLIHVVASATIDNVEVTTGGDTTAPSPDPMTFATNPYATGTTSISMTATTATDASGVEYYFDCTAGGGNDSGWQDGTTYEDTGLSPSTQYTYRVQARDKSSNQNETGYSTTKSATTDTPSDTTPPSPDPMTWATEPYATGVSSISMTATTATDASGVEYYFECTAGGGHSSSWQDSTTYEDTGLDDLTQYTYRVKARDKSSNLNETAYSTSQSATTLDGTAPGPNPMTWATVPYATGTTSISMTATTATDASGVEYYFDCTAGGGNDSGWQDSATYEDTGLSPETQYTYQVQSRDKSSNQNTTGWSTEKSATTDSEAGPNLVSWWKLDESSGTVADDSSGNNHDGTRTGGSWAPTSGKFDGAVDLGDATSDRVQVPTTGMSVSAGTVSVWGRMEGTQSGHRYFFGHTSGDWEDSIQLYMDNTNNNLHLGFGGVHPKHANIMTLSVNTWYHIALTWDGTNYVVYVDGIEKASGTYTGLSTLNSIADIGNDGNTGYRIEAFQGLLDEVRIYDGALSKYDIADLAGITIASSPSPADEATDVSTTADLSWSAGYYAADVNGHDVYLGTDYNSVADANHSSSEFKGNQTATTYDPGTMTAEITYYWAIDEVNDSNTWAGDIWSFTTASSDTTAPSPDPMTWSTEPNATGSTSISMTATTATDVSGVEYYFDCTAGGGNDSGWQDSTTYEDTALSPETQYTYQVQARDKSTNQNATGWSTEKSATTESGADPNLVSWWKLDESSGTGADDSSGNDHDGTRTGGSWAPTSGKFDGAVDLGDATSDRVQVPTTGMSVSAGTVSVWGRMEGTQSGHRYFFGHTSGDWEDSIQLYMDNTNNNLHLGFGGVHPKHANIMTLSVNTWYHIALTWDGSNYEVYVDGVSKANGTYTGLSSLNSLADIGNDGNTGYRIEAFQGFLDQVRVYNKELSQSEVEALADE